MASNDVVVKFGVDTTAVGRALGGLQRQFSDTSVKLKNSFKDVTASLQKDAGKIREAFGDALALSAPFAASAAAVTKLVSAYADYEKALAGVGKTTGLAGQQLQALGKDIEEIATRTPFATNNLLKIAQTAAQLGVQGSANVIKFTETFAKLETASNVTGEFGATNLARFINLSGDVIENVDRVASAIVSLGNNSATTEAQILDTATTISQAVGRFKIPSEDILAFATTFSVAGVESELAASTIGQTFAKIQGAVLGGGEDLTTFAKIAGVTSQQFINAYGRDPQEALLLFLDGIQRLNEEGKNTTAALDAVELGGRQFGRTLPTLADNVDLLRSKLEQSREAYQANVALNTEFATQNATLSAQLSATKNTLITVAVAIGQQLAPAFIFLVTQFRELLKAFRESSPFVKTFVAALIGLVTVSTGLVAVLALTKFAIIGLGPVLSIATAALRLFGITAGGSAVALGLLTGGITIFIGLAAAAIANWTDFSTFFKNLWADIKLYVQQAVNEISGQFNRFTLDAKADFFDFASFVIGKAADVVDAVLQIGRALGVIEKQAAGTVSGIRKMANEYKNTATESRNAAKSINSDLGERQKSLEVLNQLERLGNEAKRDSINASKEAEQQAKREAEAKKIASASSAGGGPAPRSTDAARPGLPTGSDEFGKAEEGKTAKLDAEQKKRLELEKQYQEQRKILQEEGRLEEVERLAEEEGLDLQTLVLNLQTRQQIEQDFREEKAKAEAEARNQFLKDEIQFGKTIAQIRKIANSEELKQTSEFFGELATLQQSSSEKLKKIGKAAAIAQTLIDTFKGAQAAFSAVAGLGPSGFALGVARAAAATASGLARVAQIKKAQKGGVVEGTGVGDSQLMALEPGEIVVPNEATSPLRQSFDELVAANGGGGGGSMQITGELTLVDDVGRFVTRAQVEGTRLNTERRV